MPLLFALLGLPVGALINHLADDVPARRFTRPHCPYCGRERAWWQWLAVPAYLALQGQCPGCGAPLGLRQALVEIGLVVAFGYLWLRFDPGIRLGLYAVYACILALLLVTDVERQIIPNRVLYPAILLALVASPFTPELGWLSALIGGAVGFTFFLLAAVIGNALFGSGALGAGDVKLAAFVGLITGFPLIGVALVLTILSGSLTSLLLLVMRVRGLRDPIPYGPFLILGGMATLLWGWEIFWGALYR